MNNPAQPKSRRPANTAFKQQRLKAWQPLLTPKSVLPTLFIVGIIFAPLGGFLLTKSQQVSEIIIDYTQCDKATDTFSSTNIPSGAYSYAGPLDGGKEVTDKMFWKKETIGSGGNSFTRCTVKFHVPVDLEKSVFMYYRLTNFYQNHRRYVKSFDPNQLRGKVEAEVDGNCKPLDKKDSGEVYYPCGLIANSLFNDTISDLVNEATPTTVYKFSDKGIAWPSDKSKYVKPDVTKIDFNKLIPPPNWQVRFANNRYNATSFPDLANDERFQVWMRTAGLPNFRKLYGRNDNDKLVKGYWTVTVDSHFVVNTFGGTKSIVISTVSFLGGKNPFLGIAYMVVGVICIVLALVFTGRHLYKPRKLGDHTYLSWNQQPVGSPTRPSS